MTIKEAPKEADLLPSRARQDLWPTYKSATNVRGPQSTYKYELYLTSKLPSISLPDYHFLSRYVIPTCLHLHPH